MLKRNTISDEDFDEYMNDFHEICKEFGVKRNKIKTIKGNARIYADVINDIYRVYILYKQDNVRNKKNKKNKYIEELEVAIALRKTRELLDKLTFDY